MENFKYEIFEKLGHLFYAIAKDQNVEPLQFGELKLLMRKDWLAGPLYSDPERITESVQIITVTLDKLQTEGSSAEVAFRSFTDFYETHQEQFSIALKEKILSTAQAIVEIFPLTNRVKNNHLIKLKLLFQKSSMVA
jgi:hypothetical protein